MMSMSHKQMKFRWDFSRFFHMRDIMEQPLAEYQSYIPPGELTHST